MVEGARLESVFRGNSNVGSNPTLSAIKLCDTDEGHPASPHSGGEGNIFSGENLDVFKVECNRARHAQDAPDSTSALIH